MKRKDVFISSPVALKQDRRGMLDAVCFAHDVELKWECYDPHDRITLVLTRESYDLREFSRRIGLLIEGPQAAVDAILLDASMLE